MKTKNFIVSVMWSCHHEKVISFFGNIFYIANGEVLYVFYKAKKREKYKIIPWKPKIKVILTFI